MSTNRLADLPRPSKEFPRQFVPDNTDLTDWENVEPLFNNLLDRNLDSLQSLEQLFLDESELLSVLQEEGARLRLHSVTNTNDKEAESAFISYVENIASKVSSFKNKLEMKQLDCPYIDELDPARYKVLIRSLMNSVKLFREENIPLIIEVTKLNQKYGKTMGAMTTEFRGKTMPIQQLYPYLEIADRDLRKDAFTTIQNRMSQDREKIDSIYDEMLKLRNKISENTGFDNYRDYIFQANERFDYTPDDCEAFHDSIERFILPLTRDLLNSRAGSLDIESVKPWDRNCDPFGREPLKPFEQVDELINGCHAIFDRVDPALGSNFKTMMDLGLLDLESRKGKAPGGFQMPLAESRLPFIFMNAVGTNRDVFTLIHEGGHAFHQFAFRNEPLIANRSYPKEFAEVASMSMELMGAEHLDVFYNNDEIRRSRINHFEGTFEVFPSVAMIDAFQHWIYTNPMHTSEERSKYWVSLADRFSSGIDWSGYEKHRKHGWMGIPHLFGQPFYYVEYGIAQLGALQVWRNSLEDREGALQSYKNGLALGGTKPLPELFEATGVKFDFSAATIKPLSEKVQVEIEKLKN